MEVIKAHVIVRISGWSTNHKPIQTVMMALPFSQSNVANTSSPRLLYALGVSEREVGGE